VTEWLGIRSSMPVGMTHRALFVSQRGTRLNCSAVDNIVRKIGHKAGLVLCASSLRDTFFSDLAASGADKKHVAQLLGSRRASARYL
jgi:site-specific recombinase XerD